MLLDGMYKPKLNELITAKIEIITTLYTLIIDVPTDLSVESQRFSSAFKELQFPNGSQYDLLEKNYWR